MAKVCLCVDEDILYIGGVKVQKKVRTSGGSEGGETVGASGAGNGSRRCGRAYRKDIIVIIVN